MAGGVGSNTKHFGQNSVIASCSNCFHHYI